MKRWIRVSLVLLFLSSVRVIPCTRTAEASILPSSPRRAAAPEAKIATDLVPTSTALELVAWLNGIETWILSLDVGTQVLKNTEDTPDSIFINGNFARLLASIHRITGRETGLREALRWCDSFYVHQRLAPTSKTEEGGFWVDLSRNPKGNIYFGDGGTAAAALAVVLNHADAKRKALYLGALERYARFVMDGCLFDPQSMGREAVSSWVIQDGENKGALGCGYYLGHLSVKPYTISTATTGGGFFSALYGLTGKPEYKDIAAGAVAWLLKIQKPDGEIPYTLDGQIETDWPLDTLTYCTEAFVAADACLKDENMTKILGSRLKPTVDWLLARQNPDGSWGEMQSPDQQRSPRAVTLLAWYYRNVDPAPKIKNAVLNYCLFLLDSGKSASYG
ncbi:MAG: prenyltransferase/squalene oxidase repeat-containing protein, partial [Acidobacteriota bacterium]|nr:prenyltransferase/squalene oxidase repeat-containing protein [Acidobacteriota bacterium]